MPIPVWGSRHCDKMPVTMERGGRSMNFTLQGINGLRQSRANRGLGKFLHSDANHNPQLSNGPRQGQRYWSGPFSFRLAHLKRCTGPEEYMESTTPRERWDGYDPPALQSGLGCATCDCRRSRRSPERQAYHRLKDMMRAGSARHWITIWSNDPDGLEKRKG
jgi:hypothetical protein